MTEHVTAAPRHAHFAGPLDGVPRTYRHSVCGVVTGMPEEIVRTYLVNPLAYNDGSFCCGCGAYVDSAELVWEETGENVLDYMGKLRLDYLRSTLGITGLPRIGRRESSSRRGSRSRSAPVPRDSGMAHGCVLLGLPATGETNYKLDVANRIDERTHKRFDVFGLDVAVDKRDAGRVGGIVLDYQETPRPGFAISRLDARPSESA